MTTTVPALGTRSAEGSALQAVLLDMDGTLVDTEGFWWDVERTSSPPWATAFRTPGARSWSAAP